MKTATKLGTGVALAVLGALGTGNGAIAQTVNNCSAAVAEDHTTDVGTVVIQFGAIGGTLKYSPNCITVAPTTSIQFVPVAGTNFGGHPLVAGSVSGGVKTPDNVSPITNKNSGATQPAFTISTPGIYGYYCDFHAVSFDMNGAIVVLDPDPIFADDFEGTP
jgi:plastocyanin